MAYRYRRRLRWRRKARRFIARRRRYFRRAGVVSKFATPGAINKLSQLKKTTPTDDASILTKIIEANRCIKIIYKAWKKKNPRMITLTNYLIASDPGYKTITKSDVIKKMRDINKIMKVIKIAATMGQSGALVTNAVGELNKPVLAVSTLAKCKNIGQMMMVHKIFTKDLGVKNEDLNTTLNSMIDTCVVDVRNVIPYVIPVVQANAQAVNP